MDEHFLLFSFDQYLSFDAIIIHLSIMSCDVPRRRSGSTRVRMLKDLSTEEFDPDMHRANSTSIDKLGNS